MSRNINRITNWYSKQAAWEDWRDAANRATARGFGEIVATLVPPITAGHARIDKATLKLCKVTGIRLPAELVTEKVQE